ncbi:MATE family efflux transporter [Pseudomonas viridiflava]|uniref:MATE family efflux transporter n=1 Tax=Pseudomonas viridiflava TaxID=33069 RepID=UPI000F049C39|nr:MATE family efflux transporter [Pseudomonas viridiflava]
MAVARATFTEGRIARHILVMSSTSALSLFAVFLVDILTLVYVSMLHQPLLLAAVGIAKVLIFLNSALANGLILSAATVLSERIGHRASQAVSRFTTSLILMVLIVCGLSAVLQLVLIVPITHLLGADAATYEAARVFIWLTLPFSVLQSAMQMSAQILRTAGDSRRALWVVLSGAVTLAVADPLLIFVLGLGLEGAGISYALSALVSASLGLYWVRRHVGMRVSVRPKLLHMHVKRTFRVALPAMVGNLATPVGLAYLVSSVATFGTSALAAMAVLDRVLQFSYCAFFALPSALAPVLGQNIGAHLDKRASAAIVFSRRLVVVYGLFVWGLLVLSCGTIADFYGLEGEGRALFLAFCQLGGGLWVLIGLDFVSISVFVTMQRPWFVAMFAWLRSTAGTVPFVFVGMHVFGSSGLMPGMFAGNALIAVISTAVASITATRFFERRIQPASAGII